MEDKLSMAGGAAEGEEGVRNGGCGVNGVAYSPANLSMKEV